MLLGHTDSQAAQSLLEAMGQSFSAMRSQATLRVGWEQAGVFLSKQVREMCSGGRWVSSEDTNNCLASIKVQSCWS